MVKILTDMDSKRLPTFKKSSFDLIEELRTEASQLCEKLDRPALIPDWDDLVAFWYDMDREDCGTEKEVRQLLKEERPELLSYYTLQQVEWGIDFFQTLIEPLWHGWEKSKGLPLKDGYDCTGFLDYMMYFSVLHPFPDISTPMFILVPAFFKEKRDNYRKQLSTHIVEKEPQILTQLLTWEDVDKKYLHYISYQGLRKLVYEEYTRTGAFKEAREALLPLL